MAAKKTKSSTTKKSSARTSSVTTSKPASYTVPGLTLKDGHHVADILQERLHLSLIHI